MACVQTSCSSTLRTLFFLVVLFGISIAQDVCRFKDGNTTSSILIIRNITESTPPDTVIAKADVVGTDAQVELSLSTLPGQHNPLFRFDPVTRDLIVNGTLDFEMTRSHALTLNCKTPLYQSGIQIIVELSNVNEFPPEFKQTEFTAQLSELSKPEQVVYSVTASDGDSLNSGFTYAISPGPYADYFSFELPSQGDITLKRSVDYESVQSVSIAITAVDGGPGTKLTSTATITFLISDEDDTNPKFTHDLYSATIQSRAATPGTVISPSPSVISAADQDLSLNASLEYTVSNVDDMFSIDSSTGVIQLIKQPRSGTHIAIIKATQVNNPNQYTTAVLQLTVLGNTTTISVEGFPIDLYTAEVMENAPVGTAMLRVIAIAPNQNDPFMYLLEGDSGYFNINESTGIVYLQRELDYEEKSEHVFVIKAETNSLLTSETNVIIEVIDMNDHAPQINETYIEVATVRENKAFVTQIQASDRDLGSSITYSFLGEHSHFSINSEGEIFIQSEADALTSNSYQLTVIVSDNQQPPLTTTCVVNVTFTTALELLGGEMDETHFGLAIGFGVITAVLLVMVILLVAYIIRKRLNKDENLDKVKPPPTEDAKGLAYTATRPTRYGSEPRLDIQFDGNLEESTDGCTSVQENPIHEDRHQYYNATDEADRDHSEILIDTAVTPYPENLHTYSNGYANGGLKTFHYGSSDESLSSESSPGSKTHLMNSRMPNKWGLPKHSYNNNNGLDPDTSIAPIDEKPEITVYF